MNKTATIIIGLILIGGSFYTGTKYNPGTIPTMSRNFNRGNSSSGNGFTAGEIIAKDNKSITIRLRENGSRIVFLTSATPVTKSVNGSVSDLIAGEQVSITGTPNQDGSLSAESIQIRPIMINNLSTNNFGN